MLENENLNKAETPQLNIGAVSGSYYLVRYCGGSYDDYYSAVVFVTNKKSTATKYCSKFNKALKNGQISRVKTCERCGTTEGRIVAHHSSYSLEDALKVAWLCVKCHGQVHCEENCLWHLPILATSGKVSLEEII